MASRLSSISLRTQVVGIALVLALGATVAIIMTADTLRSTRESIVRLNLERLRSLSEELARRHGSVMGFIAEEQFDDSTVAHRPEMRELLATITGEELLKYPGAQAGFFHAIWNTQLGVVRMTGDTDLSPALQRFLRAVTQNVLDQRLEQSGQYEIGEANYIIAGTPVYARSRLVGVAWAVDDLSDDLSESWRFNPAPLLPLAVLAGLLLAGLFMVLLRRDVKAIQDGLDAMKTDLAHRLPTSGTELGRISGSINALADTIARQQTEADSLRKRIEQAEKLAALGQLVAGVAHEIRTPLSLIRTRIQLWQRGMGSRRVKSFTPDAMKAVLGELDRVEEIVRKLLYFSKQRALRKQSIDIREFLETTLDALTADFRRKKIRVERDLAVEGVVCEADPAELREVFFNLFQNAIDALPSGGTVSVRVRSHAEDLLVIVEDDGAGVPPSHADRIFDPFFTTKETGVGLGLSIANEIVRSHGGRLEYSASPGGGSRFSVILPLRRDH